MNTNPHCKCCLHHDTRLIGSLDFNKTCLDERLGKRVFPVSEIEIPYYACKLCGFIFCDYMDEWDSDTFKSRIYNEQYILADPPIPGKPTPPPRERPAYATGLMLAQLLAGSENLISVLDFGSGGNPGPTGLALLDKGFDCYSYDPYRTDTATLNHRKFDVIIAAEVIEHCHNLDDLGSYIVKHLARDGIVWISTQLHPFPTPDGILNSWYIAPRNGHISIFTFQSLTVFFRRYHISLAQTIYGLIVFRAIPEFPNAFFA